MKERDIGIMTDRNSFLKWVRQKNVKFSIARDELHLTSQTPQGII